MMAHSGIAFAVVAVALIGFLRVPYERPTPILSIVAAFLVIVPWYYGRKVRSPHLTRCLTIFLHRCIWTVAAE